MTTRPILVAIAIFAAVVAVVFFQRWSKYEFSEQATGKGIFHNSETGEFAIELTDGRVLVFEMEEDYHARFPGYIEKYRDLIQGATVHAEKFEFIFLGGQRSARESASLGISFKIPNRMRDFPLSSDIHFSHGGNFLFGGSVQVEPHVQPREILNRFNSSIETPIKFSIVCKRYFSFGDEGPSGP